MTRKGTDGGNDEKLLDELRLLANDVDPVPSEVTAYADAALGWRRIDAELAELLDDPVESTAAAGTRAGAARESTHTFRWESESDPEIYLEIYVEIRDDEPGVLLIGQLAPATAASIEVQRYDRSVVTTVEADALGRFRIHLSEGGQVRLRVIRDSGPTVETRTFAV
jgi:hypothetical protein